MINESAIRKMDLFYKFSNISSTLIRNQKIAYCTYDLESVEKLGIFDKIMELKLSTDSVQLITYNSLECYGIFKYLNGTQEHITVVGPVLTVRPLSKENYGYLSFCHLYDEETVKNFIHLIPLMPLGEFANALSMFFYQMNEVYYSADRIQSEKIDFHEFIDGDEFSQIVPMDSPNSNHKDHILKDIERYLDVIKTGNIKKLEDLFKDRVLFYSFTDGTPKLKLYTIISLSTMFGLASIEGGLDFFEASSLGNTFITLAESFENSNDFIATFKKMTKGFVTQVHESQSKYKYSKSIKKAMSYIDRHIHFPLSLETVSQSVGLSRPYLSQLFSKEVGKSLQTYIQLKKMEEAEKLVRFTKMSMSDIASSLSFCSQSYFTEVFKKYSSITPVQYRKKHLK